MAKKGDSVLAKYRRMNSNLLRPTLLTQSPSAIWFGSKVSIKAPHVQGLPSDPEVRGAMISAFISEFQIDYHQDVFDGCGLAGICEPPNARNTFVICSSDYCNREGEALKFNQDFALALEKTINTQPLFVRYDPEPLPGYNPTFPFYLSKNQVTNTRFRVLPVQDPNNTRFEQEGKAVQVNTDVVLNHSKSGVNVAVTDTWTKGFFISKRGIAAKTKLDVYKNEMDENIWHIHSAIPDPPKND